MCCMPAIVCIVDAVPAWCMLQAALQQNILTLKELYTAGEATVPDNTDVCMALVDLPPAVLGRLKQFLPQMEAANVQMQQQLQVRCGWVTYAALRGQWCQSSSSDVWRNLRVCRRFTHAKQSCMLQTFRVAFLSSTVPGLHQNPICCV